MTIPWTLVLNGRQWTFNRRSQADGATFSPSACAKVCPRCVRPWAQSYPSSALTQATHFSIQGQCCETCQTPDTYSLVPGSILTDHSRQDFDHDLFFDLPLELLVREFHLHLKVFSND